MTENALYYFEFGFHPAVVGEHIRIGEWNANIPARNRLLSNH